MPRVIVLPTGEDQAAVSSGRPPHNRFDRTFETAAEARSYVDGIGSMADLAEFEIISDDGLRLVALIGNDEVAIDFATAPEKQAYIDGLEDGDGFFSAKCIGDDEPEFAEVAAMLDSTPITPQR